MKAHGQITKAFQEWVHARSHKSGMLPRGTISGALVVLERLQTTLDLNIDGHTAKGGAQITGASGATVKKILARFGEQRKFVSEGGRTNRGLRGAIKEMLLALREAGLERLGSAERIQVLNELQKILLRKVDEYHSKQRLKIPYSPTRTTADFIRAILEAAKAAHKEGPVAQYLVGAKLQLRFPKETISNESYSTADEQLGRRGDFKLSDTVFHVTVAPMPALYDKCRQNIADGYKVYLLVPEKVYSGARQNADLAAAGQITVLEVERFVAQNVDEMSLFSSAVTRGQVKELLRIYNERVDAVELEKSMLIEVPPNL